MGRFLLEKNSVQKRHAQTVFFKNRPLFEKKNITIALIHIYFSFKKDNYFSGGLCFQMNWSISRFLADVIVYFSYDWTTVLIAITVFVATSYFCLECLIWEEQFCEIKGIYKHGHPIPDSHSTTMRVRKGLPMYVLFIYSSGSLMLVF